MQNKSRTEERDQDINGNINESVSLLCPIYHIFVICSSFVITFCCRSFLSLLFGCIGRPNPVTCAQIFCWFCWEERPSTENHSQHKDTRAYRPGLILCLINRYLCCNWECLTLQMDWMGWSWQEKYATQQSWPSLKVGSERMEKVRGDILLNIVIRFLHNSQWFKFICWKTYESYKHHYKRQVLFW